ncbi:MAG: DoxX family protein, partial [Acidobacteriota bacterium]|nr:DoxX family protein [Acidobacteriota bacterium]
MKALDPLHFASEIENYRLVSWPIGMRAAFYLPWLEIFCGLALIVGWMRSGAMAILTAAMIFFIGLSILTRARGIDLACGCFGAAGKGLGFSAHLAIDFALVAALGLLWWLSARMPER